MKSTDTHGPRGSLSGLRYFLASASSSGRRLSTLVRSEAFLAYTRMYSWPLLILLRASGDVRFCQMMVAMKFDGPKMSSHIIFRLACSLSSILMKIAPVSLSKRRSICKRGYIMHSHLSCREKSSPSLPTTSPSQRRILGSFTLSL